MGEEAAASMLAAGGPGGKGDSKDKAKGKRMSKEKALHLAMLHELHAVGLVWRAQERSKWCDDEELHARLLSLLPRAHHSMFGSMSVANIERLLGWFRRHVAMDSREGLFVSCSQQVARMQRCVFLCMCVFVYFFVYV
jgi:hypothetical protein